MYPGIAKVRDSGQGRPLFLLHLLGLGRFLVIMAHQVEHAMNQQQGQLPVNGRRL